MENIKDVLLRLAADAKVALEKAMTAEHTYLNQKIDLDKSEAQFKLDLKATDPKVTQVSMDNQADVHFNVERKLLSATKLAAKQADIDAEYAHDKLKIEEIVAQIPAGK